MQLNKPFWKSKTFWFNVVGGVIVLLQYIGTLHIVNPTTMSTIMVVGNFLLRFVTKTGITLS